MIKSSLQLVHTSTYYIKEIIRIEILSRPLAQLRERGNLRVGTRFAREKVFHFDGKSVRTDSGETGYDTIRRTFSI